MINIHGKSKVVFHKQTGHGKPLGHRPLLIHRITNIGEPFTAALGSAIPANFEFTLLNVGSVIAQNAPLEFTVNFTGDRNGLREVQRVVIILTSATDPNEQANVTIKLVANAEEIKPNELKINFLNTDPTGNELADEVMWIANDSNSAIDLSGCMVTYRTGVNRQNTNLLFVFRTNLVLDAKSNIVFNDPRGSRQLIANDPSICSLFVGGAHQVDSDNTPKTRFAHFGSPVWDNNNNGNTAQIFNPTDFIDELLAPLPSVLPGPRMPGPINPSPDVTFWDGSEPNIYNPYFTQLINGSEICSVTYRSGQFVDPNLGVTDVPRSLKVISNTTITVPLIDLIVYPADWNMDSIWVPTGVISQKGDFIDLTATGTISPDLETVSLGGPFKSNGPTGRSTELQAEPTQDLWNILHWPYQRTNAPDHTGNFPQGSTGSNAFKYCLIAKIGETGNTFFVGSSLPARETGNAGVPDDREEGQIFLAINSYRPFNKVAAPAGGPGAFACNIVVSRN